MESLDTYGERATRIETSGLLCWMGSQYPDTVRGQAVEDAQRLKVPLKSYYH